MPAMPQRQMGGPSNHLFLLLAPLLWGGNFVVGRHLGADVPAVWLNLLRWSVALAVLLPVGLIGLLKDGKALRQDAGKLVILSAFGVIGFNTTLYAALQYISAAEAALVFALTPFFILLLQFAIVQRIPSRRVVFAAALSLVGIAMAREGYPNTTSEFGVWPLGLMLLAALIWAGYCVGLKELTLASRPLSALIGQIFIGLTLQGSVALLWGSTFELKSLTTETWWSIGYIGVFAAALAFLLWQAGIRRAKPGAAGVFMNLVPVSGILFAWIFLDETPSVAELSGISLVAIGVYVVWRETTPTQQRIFGNGGASEFRRQCGIRQRRSVE